MNRESSFSSSEIRPSSSHIDDPLEDIGQTLERLAVSQPNAPAIHVPGSTTLSYADLAAQIRYVRVRLGDWNISRSDVVVGVIPSRPEMAVACATTPGAATFAPLSPALNADNYVELLTRLRPKLVIVANWVDHPIRAAAKRCGVAEASLTPDPSAPAGMLTLELIRQDRSLAGEASSRADWAYVLNTSGTTGRPKLVPYSHQRLTSYAKYHGEWGVLAASDVGCHLIPMHHATGLLSGLMIPLLRGASVVCLPESDIDGFFAALDEYRITWFPAGFAVHREILLRVPDFREAVARNRLRCIRVASGQLEPDEIDRIERTFGAPLFENYGMTEAASITYNPPPPHTRKRGSAGIPSCNQVAIMSEGGAICSAGDVGEVVVRGPLVFDGYFDDAQATAEAFVDGWFRTGDLGRFDEDGYLYLIGRVKELINRGGEKIAPLEIDTVIEAIPGIREAATFAIPHRSLGEEIVAAVVKNGDAAITQSDIIDQVRQRMGPKRVPRQIYFVDQLPRTDSGKVRRSELPRLLGLDKPGVAAPTASLEASAPALSALEAALVGLWSTVLQVKGVAVHDDFFVLGGDMLRGARLLASIKAVFGVDLAIQELSGNAATVAGMARAIEAARSVNAGADRG